jgi:hypothetical protein
MMQKRLDRSVDVEELRRTHRQSEALAAQLRALHEEVGQSPRTHASCRRSLVSLLLCFGSLQHHGDSANKR